MTKELHHIVPRCMGGSDGPSNLVLISARAHAILSVYQSEHYGRPCIHRRQLKYLPPHLYERGKFWVSKAAEKGGKAKWEKYPDLDKMFHMHNSYRKRFTDELEYSKEQSRRGLLLSENRKRINNGVIEKYISKFDIIPPGWVEGYMSRYVINNGVTNRFIPLTEPIPPGWVKGRVRLK